MMGFRFEEIVNRIRDEKGIDAEEIERRVKQKLDKLSGLISKEGAAHIVANELGVDLISSMKKHGIRISQVMPGMRNVTIVGCVVKDYGVRTYQKENREGKVASFLAGDESGAMRVVVWDTELMNKMEAHRFAEGCVVRASDGFIKENNGYREMHLGSRSILEVNPAGVEVKRPQLEMKQQYNRKSIKDLNEGDFVRIIGTAVQVFEPKFYEGCSECGKKLEQGACREHGSVKGAMHPVLNFYLDDGTGNLPVVVFRDVVAKTLQLSAEDVIGLQNNPGAFEAVKQGLLGRQLTAGGKVQKNTMFERIEMVANLIEEVNPEDLVKELSSDGSIS